MRKRLQKYASFIDFTPDYHQKTEFTDSDSPINPKFFQKKGVYFADYK
jgi:hypothetical protein